MTKKERHIYIEDEEKYDWLPMLLDAYKIADDGTAKCLKASGKGSPCSKGCYACCLNPSVPINPIEIAGISWYCAEKITGQLRKKLKQKLLKHNDDSLECLFLIEGSCSIYPLRPLACRQFYVFGEKCKPFEDILKTRPQDILRFDRKYAKKVAMKILPFFEIFKDSDKIKAFDDGFIMAVSIEMHRLDWKEIYKNMISFEKS